MPITRSDWVGAWDNARNSKTALIRCSCCRHQWQVPGDCIGKDGAVKSRHCPKCNTGTGDMILSGWPWELDAE